jgi:hypothetical protein
VFEASVLLLELDTGFVEETGYMSRRLSEACPSVQIILAALAMSMPITHYSRRLNGLCAACVLVFDFIEQTDIVDIQFPRFFSTLTQAEFSVRTGLRGLGDVCFI